VESCSISADKLNRFLLKIQSNYGSNEYHNSMHGADVLLFSHLFLTKHGLHARLSKAQLLGVLLGAIVHDFNHPGTTSAHEVKLGSSLAITYSDQSVLEFHHLWASFTVFKTSGLDILSGLSTEEYRTVRSVMIQLILHTDLSKHFDHIGKLKTLATGRGYKKCKDDYAQRREAEQLQDASAIAGFKRRGTVSENTAQQMFGRRKSHNFERRMTNMGHERRNTTFAKGEGSSLTSERRGSFQAQGQRSRVAIEHCKLSPEEDASPLSRDDGPKPFEWVSPFADESIDVMLLLNTAIKWADLNHCSKPLALHELWTNRITNEFWVLGDKERKLGVPVSPLCSRETDNNIAKSQIGFFQFICSPFFEVVGDLVDPAMPPLQQMHSNFAEWKRQVEGTKEKIDGDSFSFRRQSKIQSSGDKSGSSEGDDPDRRSINKSSRTKSNSSFRSQETSGDSVDEEQ